MAENNFLLESLTTCHDSNTKLIMYFTINSIFTKYLNEFNLTEELDIPILINKSTSEVTLPVFLNKSLFNGTLLFAPLTLREYITQCTCIIEIFDLKERHDIDEFETESASKNFFTNNFIIDVFVFIIAIILVISTIIIIYAICKHNKLRSLVTSLAFQQAKEVKAEEISKGNHNCECTAQFYIILALTVIIIGLVVFMVLQVRRIKLYRG